MTYDEAIKYIHSTSNFFCKPGLERISKLCEELGNPEKELRFIHVGGTNGKGSFCAMTDSVLRSAGYKVGLFTSPYILRFNERMQVNGESISDETLARLTKKAKAIADKMTDKPTEFELITAIAFDYFKEEKCDIVILEVGMGGRLDATNVIDSPLISVITGIALDHTAYLGDTVEKIAGEKAGIIKRNSVALFGGDDTGAERVIAQKALEMQTMLYKTDYSRLKITKSDLCGSIFNYKDRENLKISLAGEYQPGNAAILLDCIDILSSRGISVSEDAIYEGLLKARWPARFEVIGKDPIILFDGAHNPQGIKAATESIKAYYTNKRVVVLTGVLRDKDYRTIAKLISEIADFAYTITPNNPRALTAVEYAAILNEFGLSAVPCPSIQSALFEGVKTAKEKNSALCCLGSLYTYGEIIEALGNLN